PITPEEVVNVAAQLEEVERVTTMGTNESACRLVGSAVRKLVWGRQRPEEHIAGRDDRHQARQTDGDGDPGQVVAEHDRGLRPATEVERVDQHLDSVRTFTRSDPDEASRGDEDSDEARAQHEQRRSPGESLMADDERVATPPEKGCAAPAKHCLLEVKPLENV